MLNGDIVPDLVNKQTMMATQNESFQFIVRNRSHSGLKIIPYIGCKAGFDHVFDQVIPAELDRPIYDIFGGGGSFAFYAAKRFGSHKVTYNDNNPVIVNLIEQLKLNPTQLWTLYNKHYQRASVEHYYRVRDQEIADGLEGAANFLYLAKNAFSGKIRFNAQNRFNSPIRKGSNCPKLKLDAVLKLSELIQDMTITNLDYKQFTHIRSSLVYLDPPYFNNLNGHYNGVLNLNEFNQYLRTIERNNMVVLSEQNNPEIFELSKSYNVFRIMLRRSLQYQTQQQSQEIIACNY